MRRTGTYERPDGDTMVGTRKRVLVVEDVVDERELLATALRAEGHDVSAAGDGLEALELIERVPRGWFSLVVVDHMLPRLTGVEVLSRTSSRARFLVVTGMRNPILRATAIALGAEDVLTKPVDLATLVSIVRAILAGESQQH